MKDGDEIIFIDDQKILTNLIKIGSTILVEYAFGQ